MQKTDISKLRMMSEQFDTMSEEKLQMFVDDSWIEVLDLNVPELYQERLNRYLAAHLAFSDIKEVAKEAAGPLSREYQKRAGNDLTDILSTPFGQEYQRLVDKLTKEKKKINLVVL